MIEIGAGKRQPREGERPPFSLIFRRAGGGHLRPVLNDLVHDTFTARRLLVSQIQFSLDPTDRNAYYEIVFN